MLNNELLCSVIIPTYDRADLLSKTLQTVYRSTLPKADFEVIVVDDGSSDNSFSVSKEFEKLGNLKYIYQPDAGFRAARARNLGIRLAEGDICIFIDSGMLVESRILGAHLAAHRNNPKHVVLGKVLGIYTEEPAKLSWTDRMDASEIDSLMQHQIAAGTLTDPRQVCFDICNGKLGLLPMPWGIAWTANISVPRRELERVGGFDENYVEWGCEDLDLALTLYRAGLGFALAPEALAVHAPHEISERNAKTNDLMMRYMHQKFRLPETEEMISTSRIELNSKLREGAVISL